MLSSLLNLLVHKLKLVLKILSSPINTLSPIKLKSVKLKAVVKKKPKMSRLPRELLILSDKSLSQKNIMIHLRVNTALLRREKVLLNLDQELKFKIMSAPKLISQTLLQVQLAATTYVDASEHESTSLFCRESRILTFNLFELMQLKLKLEILIFLQIQNKFLLKLF